MNDNGNNERDDMTQAYSDPARETEPHALPNIEVFWMDSEQAGEALDLHSDWERVAALAGWYWWACFPGCLPDSEPMGPFETEALALADAQDC